MSESAIAPGGIVLASEGVLGENGMIGRLANDVQSTVVLVVTVVVLVVCAVSCFRKPTPAAIIGAAFSGAFLFWLLALGGIFWLGERFDSEMEAGSAAAEVEQVVTSHQLLT